MGDSLIIAEANAIHVEQAVAVIRAVGARGYGTAPRDGVSSVGAHVRHIVEHYRALFDGLDGGTVDYDARPRDRTIEREPLVAGAALRDCAERLRALDPSFGVRPLEVRDGIESEPSRSTVGRELAFLLSHTIHHLAIIRMVAHDLGVTLPEDVGVAPATLAYRRSVA